MWLWIRLAALLVALSTAWAGSATDFGLSEFQAANATRKWPIKVKSELSLDPPESYRIEVYPSGGGRVTGGDLRGLMYGLIEAASQLRSLGHLKAVRATPVV